MKTELRKVKKILKCHQRKLMTFIESGSSKWTVLEGFIRLSNPQENYIFAKQKFINNVK